MSNYMCAAPSEQPTIATASAQTVTTQSSHEDAPPKVVITAGKADSKGRRLVTAVCGNCEHRDEIRCNRDDDRNGFIRRLAEKYRVDKKKFVHLHDDIIAAANSADEQAITAKIAAQAEPADEIPPEVIEAAKNYLTNPDMIAELRQDIRDLGVVGEVGLATTLYMVTVSRLLPKPLSACVQAASSSGKSYVVEHIAKLLPDASRIYATNITPNALYYMEPDSLKHRVIVIGESQHYDPKNQADGMNATLALREMMSRGRLDKVVTVKGADGEMTTVRISQDGPVSVLQTTTAEDLIDENINRMLRLSTDESPSQTAGILSHLAREAAGILPNHDRREAIRQKHRLAHQQLEQKNVRIPFATHLQIPSHQVDARRAYSHLLQMIQAVALLRQKQKPPGDVIDADVKDYEIAYELMLPVLRRVFHPLSEGARSTLETIRANVTQPQGTTFTRAECCRWCGLSARGVANRIKALVDAGALREHADGRAFRYQLQPNDQAQRATLGGLLSPEQLRERLACEAPHATEPSSDSE